MKQDEFEKLVVEAIDALPPVGKAHVDNVAFFVEPEVRKAKATEMHIEKGQLLLGLYEGVSKASRGLAYSGTLPDKITIFQRPIEMLAGGDSVKLKEILFGVVRHEIGHHLGFDEAGVRNHEANRKAIENI
jgi:predicted Zn-dependent protease with MMP-like domain